MCAKCDCVCNSVHIDYLTMLWNLCVIDALKTFSNTEHDIRIRAAHTLRVNYHPISFIRLSIFMFCIWLACPFSVLPPLSDSFSCDRMLYFSFVALSVAHQLGFLFDFLRFVFKRFPLSLRSFSCRWICCCCYFADNISAFLNVFERSTNKLYIEKGEEPIGK